MADDEANKFNVEQFQRHMYAIFKDKGLLSGLKTHLRHCMIEALKTNNIGQKLIFQQSNRTISPKYQALNILIAEYLFSQHYHFTLSVFSSEVPMHSCLPEFIKIVLPLPNEKLQNENEVNPKLEEKDVFDILEAFGFPQDTECAQNIYSLYKSNPPEDTLLLCLIRTLAPFLRRILSSTEKTNVCLNCTDKIDYEDLLKIEKENFASKLQKHMQTLFDQEIVIIQNAERKKYEQCLKQMETDYNLNLQEFMAKEQQLKLEISNLEKDFEMKILTQKIEYDTEKQNLQKTYNLMLEENKIAVENMLQIQYNNVQLTLKKIKLYAEKLNKKEESLGKKMKDIEQKIKNDSIQPNNTINHSPHEDKHFIEKIEKDLNKTKAEIYEVIKSITNSKKSPKILLSKEVQTDSILKSVGSNTEGKFIDKSGSSKGLDQADFENTKKLSNKAKFHDLKKIIKTLHKENTYLKAFNSQQRKQIHDLITKQTSMKKEVTLSRSELNLLNNQLEVIKKYSYKTPEEKTKLPRAMSAPSTLNREKRLNYSLKNKKFESSGNLACNNQLQQSITSDSDDEYFKKRYVKKLKQLYKNQSEDESSSTEDVLKEVKKRLKIIEKESEEIEKSFQEFKKRQAENIQDSVKIKKYAAIVKPIHLTNNVQQNIYNDPYENHFNYEDVFKMNGEYDKNKYNVMKRAQSPFMNCDNTLLYNYIQTARKAYRQQNNQIPISPISNSSRQQNKRPANILSRDNYSLENSGICKTSPTRNWMKLYNGKISSLKRYTLNSFSLPEHQLHNNKNNSNTIISSYKTARDYKSLINNYKLNNQTKMNEDVLTVSVNSNKTCIEENINAIDNKIISNEINNESDIHDESLVAKNFVPDNDNSLKEKREILGETINKNENETKETEVKNAIIDIINNFPKFVKENDTNNINILENNADTSNVDKLNEVIEDEKYENTQDEKVHETMQDENIHKFIKDEKVDETIKDETMYKPIQDEKVDEIVKDEKYENIQEPMQDEKVTETIKDGKYEIINETNNSSENHFLNNSIEKEELEKSSDLLTTSNESMKSGLSLEISIPEYSDNNDSFWKD